jgi:hypothetical protein
LQLSEQDLPGDLFGLNGHWIRSNRRRRDVKKRIFISRTGIAICWNG